MRALGYWLWHAFFQPYAQFAVTAMEAVAPRVVRIEARAQSQAAWKRFDTAVPGQFAFMRLRVPGLSSSPRPLSIAKIEREERRLSFLLKGNGVWSLALYDALPSFPKPAANPRLVGKPWLVDLAGPHGRFTLKGNTPRGCSTGPLVFIAGGIGIAPFLAMAAELARRGDKRRLLILWSAGTREDLAGIDELIALTKANHAIRTIPILSHDPLWAGRKGHIDEAALSDLAAAELADPAASYWISAPRALRAQLLKALRARGVARRRIRIEDFRL